MENNESTPLCFRWLKPSVTKEQLMKTISKYGNILWCSVKPFQATEYAGSKKLIETQSGLVNMETEDDAQSVLDNKDIEEDIRELFMEGRPIYIKLAERKEERGNSRPPSADSRASQNNSNRHRNDNNQRNKREEVSSSKKDRNKDTKVDVHKVDKTTDVKLSGFGSVQITYPPSFFQMEVKERRIRGVFRRVGDKGPTIKIMTPAGLTEKIPEEMIPRLKPLMRR
eukprot:TRINITY_DN632_c0_g1_i1.p1 TRINITY_DN632_c0_g1~~TRINITY_DN632_c0_g1_i1.p1  ORF type:complete len:226 (+),score=38.58 TRINITY_DN632_c0_g1_i1:123-800(+)